MGLQISLLFITSKKARTPMSNFIEYEDKIAFHPGYYIEELVKESGLTQEEFAHRLGTASKDLSALINGEQNLSYGLVSKLSAMQGTSEGYWFNLQAAWDQMIVEMNG